MKPEALTEIARLISNGDPAVLAELSGCLTDPAAYFAANRERYEERSVRSAEEADLIQWLGLVDILEAKGYVCERDWKDELEDFLYFFQNLSGAKRLGLELREEWLDEDGDIPEWCGILNEKWTPRHCCAAVIDIDSDSYVLFPCELDTLARLQRLAESVGHWIVRCERDV